MRLSIFLIGIGAVLGAAIIFMLARMALVSSQPVIVSAGFSHDAITPNADGVDDVAIFSYELSRVARVSLDLQGRDGQTFAFRQDALRTPARYQVAFSGVVDGFILPDEAVYGGEVIRRLIPDDTYTWRLVAVTEDGERHERTGELVVRDGDVPLPLLSEFSVYPTYFTPNQDGINDRTQINLYLSRDSELTVYLLPEGGGDPIYLAERLQDVLPNTRGRHLYDYDGGVDNNADPPPDGVYTVVAEARDPVGQIVRHTAELTIAQGGKPFAEIVPQTIGVTVVFEARPWDERFLSERDQMGDRITPPTDPDTLSRTTITLPRGDLLVFSLTVENYSSVPIRTTGPAPGTVYTWEQRASSFGATDEPGAWRVGLDCMTAPTDYPWRWALGDRDSLDVVVDPDTGVEYYYLPPGGRAVVWGAVRMTEIEVRNPQTCWAGLIHEDVEVAQRNRNVGAREIRLVEPGM